MGLGVLTLNVWNTSGRWPERRELIRAAVRELRPDVIGFQEVLFNDGWDQTDDLLDGLGYHTDRARAMTFWDDDTFEIGNAVASRWPLVDREVLAYDEWRCALAVTIDAPIGPVSFTSTHLHWTPHGSIHRERQVVALAELEERRRSEAFPSIVVGDFNAPADAAEIRFLTGRQSLDGRSTYLNDAWAVAGSGTDGATYSNRNPDAHKMLLPDRRIDYIFTGYAGRGAVGLVQGCRVVCDQPVAGVWPSDHFGVHAVLRTEPIAGLHPPA